MRRSEHDSSLLTAWQRFACTFRTAERSESLMPGMITFLMHVWRATIEVGRFWRKTNFSCASRIGLISGSYSILSPARNNAASKVYTKENTPGLDFGLMLLNMINLVQKVWMQPKLEQCRISRMILRGGERYSPGKRQHPQQWIYVLHLSTHEPFWIST